MASQVLIDINSLRHLETLHTHWMCHKSHTKKSRIFKKISVNKNTGKWSERRQPAVVPREKAHTGAAAREQPQDSPGIAR